MVALADISTPLSLGKGAQICSQGQPTDVYYLLQQGVVRLTITAPHQVRTLVEFRFPGDFLGFDEQYYEASAVALSPVMVNCIPSAELERMMREKDAVASLLLGYYRAQIRQHREHLRLLARPDALGRMAMFLEMLLRWERAPASRPQNRLYLPMTRTDLAAFVGLSGKAVSRAFSTFEARGIIKFATPRHVEILNRKGLSGLLKGK